MADYNAWAGPYGLHLPVDPAVPYLSRIDDALWVQGPDENGLAYVQYNRVDHVSLVDVTTALADADTRTVILDVRHNYGGEVSALEPVIDAFGAFATGHRKSLYLITGRNTFSAGSLLVARLDAETDAVIVGEPMGGCPTAWGNSRDFELPHSGIVVSVSTFFEIGVDPADTRLTIEPDIPATLTPDEWANGVDPALERIRGQLE
jgi:C-terminal processing protease CtpA/Prc